MCLSIAVGTLLFTSCSMYKAGMENAEYDPIPNKLPNLEYNYGGLYDQLVNNVVKDELYKNVIEVDGKPLGNIQVRCEKLDAKVNFLFPFLSGFTLFMGNILGMPYVAGSIDMELEFLIEDINGDVVKRYNYSDLDKYTLGFYYGEDARVKEIETCYSLNRLYKTLAESKAENVTYFLDACFSGANKEGSMLVPARGIAVRPKESIIKGNSVVFSAASGDETAMTFEDKSHGLFTYFLLKKLQETKGDVSYGELSDYIKKNVQKEAFLTNEKPQTPVTATSMDLQSTWRSMTLK